MTGGESWHGTPGGYGNHDCRCERCTRSWREYCHEGGYGARYRARLKAAGLSSAGSFRNPIPLRKPR